MLLKKKGKPIMKIMFKKLYRLLFKINVTPLIAYRLDKPHDYVPLTFLEVSVSSFWGVRIWNRAKYLSPKNVSILLNLKIIENRIYEVVDLNTDEEYKQTISNFINEYDTSEKYINYLTKLKEEVRRSDIENKILIKQHKQKHNLI